MSNWYGAEVYTMDATFCLTCGAEVGWDGCERCDGTFDTEDWESEDEEGLMYENAFTIVRDEDGNHWVSGRRFTLPMQWYRKRRAICAVQIDVPFAVQTLEGTMQAKAGDWLIMGVHGELYPCDASIFADSYELVKASPTVTDGGEA